MSSVLSAFEKGTKKSFWSLLDRLIPEGVPGPFKPGKSPSILILRPDRLGDFILSTPAIRALQKRLGPSARWTLVAGERSHEAARALFPGCKVLVFRKNVLSRLFLFTRLLIGRYDAVVDLHSYPFSTTSALMSLLSGGARRVGFWDKGGSAKISRQVFNLGAAPPAESLHERDKSSLLAKRLVPGLALGDPRRFAIPPIPRDGTLRVDSFFRKMGGGTGPILGLHPTLQKKDNRWSPKNYAELVRLLSKFPELRLVLVHGKGEEDELERFQRSLGTLPNVFALPENGLLFILEAAKRFDLFVCGDSGLTHWAALATRVFSIFGPSDPRRWGPLDTGKGRPRIFRKKDHRCDSVHPSEIAREVQKALKLPGKRSAHGSVR